MTVTLQETRDAHVQLSHEPRDLLVLQFARIVKLGGESALGLSRSMLIFSERRLAVSV